MRILRVTALFFLMGYSIWGCALVSENKMAMSQALDAVEEAGGYMNTLQNLNARTADRDAFERAAQRLSDARTAVTARDFSAARAAAGESIAVSRALLTGYYHGTVAELARRARRELERKNRQDPEDPVSNHIPTLDGMAAYAETLEEDPQIVAISRVLQDLNQVLNISDGLRTGWQKILRTDTAFDVGQYDLSHAGLQAIGELAGEVAEKIRQAYPKRPVTLTVRVVGYTDQLNFGHGTRLVERLTQGETDEIPAADPDRRRFLNYRLSRFRAEAIRTYLEALIREQTGEMPVTLETEAVGRGEEMPAGLSPPYPVSDPRRRICKIYLCAIPG
ncbi:hypothetical protein DENIS_2848 [Desulfonema ishimotonii]|uniref:OmpA-like domain-containing protein n=1 Tax=Desulfonema ishimotonii TaxID=45657 RepID=A0A401FY63_9BACT|nr:hypothetical protein [Desulfonema ishimotonii]GBC61886.1 hypothetical protein DENIS_2848 [Desulfonema ishimotonii]